MLQQVQKCTDECERYEKRIKGLEQLAGSEAELRKEVLDVRDALQTSQNALTKCRDTGKEMEQRVAAWDPRIKCLKKEVADAQMACTSKSTEYDELNG
jgi:predicted nuclease with TOPRIM domain